MAKTPVQVVSVAAFDSKGRLLMGKRQDCGKWTCPGGHMEPGEKPARAAVRELLEETGLRPGSGGLEYLGVKELKDGQLQVHSFKTTGVKGKPTGEDDPDEECQTWKWLDVEDGLPEEQEQNLYNQQDVTLQFLGFQEGPVRKFQIPPPIGDRLAKAEDPLAAHHVYWDQLQTQGWHERHIGDEGQPPHTIQLLNPAYFGPDGHALSGAASVPGQVNFVMTHGPGARDWNGAPQFYNYSVDGEVNTVPHTKVVPAPLQKAQPPAPESQVVADQLQELQDWKPTKGFTNKKGLGTNRNQVPIHDPRGQDLQRLLPAPKGSRSQPSIERREDLEAWAGQRAATSEEMDENTAQAQENNIAENLVRRDFPGPLKGNLDLHPWTEKEFSPGEVYWENPGAAADDVTSIRFHPEGLHAYSNMGPGQFYPRGSSRFQELVQRSRIPQEVVDQHMVHGIPMRKGWPKSPEENEANKAGFVRESPPTEDRLMEQGLSDKKTGTMAEHDGPPPPPELMQRGALWTNEDAIRAANWDQNRSLGSSRTGVPSSWEGMDQEVLNHGFVPPPLPHLGLMFRHQIQKGNSGFQDGRQMFAAHYIHAVDPQNGRRAATFQVLPGGQLELWGAQNRDPELLRQVQQHLQSFLAQNPDMNKSERPLRKTAEDQAHERLRAAKLVGLTEPLQALGKLARNSEFHIGAMRAQADATRADAERQIQELSRDIEPGPTPREMAILESLSSAAQLLALQSPASSRADRELVLQRLSHHSQSENDGDEALLKHLNQTLDQDQRLWLASQVGKHNRSRYLMQTLLRMEPSRWKLPERAVVADQALDLLRSESYNSRQLGATLRDMVVSPHAPTPLAPEQIQGFLEVNAVTPPEQLRQLAAHPDLPQGYLQDAVAQAQLLQKQRFRAQAEGKDFPASAHAEVDAFMVNPQVPEDVLQDYARAEVQNFNPEYGLPTSVTSLPRHRPELVDKLAPELYQSHWKDGEHGQLAIKSGTPGGILREAYVRPENGYGLQPIPETLQQQIAKKGVVAGQLPEFARQALANSAFKPQHREQMLGDTGNAEEPQDYVSQVMGSGVHLPGPELDQWWEKMQLHADARVQGWAIRNSDRINPGLAQVIRADPHGNGQDIIDLLKTRPARFPVPEEVAQTLADLVPESKAAQLTLMEMAQHQKPGITAKHLQPLLDLQDLNPQDTLLRHEALSLPQITGDQLHRVLTGPDAHRWSARLGEKNTEWAEDDRPGLEDALEKNGHKLSREQQLQLVDSPFATMAYHGARNLHPEDITPVLARSQRFTTLQGLLSNKGVTPEHLDEIATRPGMATMLTIPAKEPGTSSEVLDTIYEYRNRILAQGGDMEDLIGPLSRHKNASPKLLRALDLDLRNVLTQRTGPDADPWNQQLHAQAVLRGPQLLAGLMENPAMPMDKAVDLGEWIQDLHPAEMPEDWLERPPPHHYFARQWHQATDQDGNADPDAGESNEWDRSFAWERFLEDGNRGAWPHTRKLAAQLVQEMHPDSRFKTRVKIRPGVERLREIRDLIVDRNPEQKELSPKHLPPGDWSAGRLPNGNISAEKLQAHIDSLPGQEYNLSNTHWSNVLQRHNAFPSKVLQVNVTTDQVQKLKHAGVWPTFKAMAEASRSSSHPVNEHTLGWVRFTGTPQHGFFIDEIQSDLGQSFVKQARAQAQDRGLDPEEAGKKAEARYPEAHFQKIRDIVFAGRHPNQVLHEAFLQHLRDQGHVGVPVHIHTPETKAPISGMQALKDGKPRALPGHMIQTYGDQPRKMGYRPVTYGSIAATSTDKGPTLEISDYEPYVPGAAHTKDAPMQFFSHADVIARDPEEAQEAPVVSYKPQEHLPGATVQGTKIRKFEAEARLWLLTRVQPLRKMAINPEALREVGNLTNAKLGQAQVDDSQEHTAHPSIDEHVAQAFRSQVVDSPKVVKQGRIGSRESHNEFGKAVFNIKTHLEGLGSEHRFMVKPYHEIVDREARHWMQVPIQGWAEMTNQALYHAGNIGELHQRVHVQRVAYQKGDKPQHGPTLVIHMQPGAKTVNQTGDRPSEYSPQQQEQARKIALMDFLTNNLDRHTTNLLVVPERDQLLTVDHSRSFQYKISDKMGDGPRVRMQDRPDDDCLRQYIGYWNDGFEMGSTGLGSILAHSVDDVLETPAEMQALRTKGWDGKDGPGRGDVYVEGIGDMAGPREGGEAKQARQDFLQWHQKAMDELNGRGREEWSQAWDPAFQWFRDNHEPIRQAFESRLQLLRDDQVRDHLRQNFGARLEHLLKGRDPEKPNDWDLDPVPIFPLRRKKK